MAAFVLFATSAGQLHAGTLNLLSEFSGSWVAQSTYATGCDYCGPFDVQGGFHDSADQYPRAAYFTRPAYNGFQTSDYRSFFVFDVPADMPDVISAQLMYARNGGTNGRDGQYLLYDVTTPVSDLIASGSNRSDIFNDLGSGVIYGQHDIATTYGMVLAPFSAEGIAAFNAARGGQFAIGGRVTGWGTDFPGYNPLGTLMVTIADVPEPSTAALTVVGLTLLLASQLARIAAPDSTRHT